MQARQQTHLESMLDRLIVPVRDYVVANPGTPPLAALVAHVLRTGDAKLPELEEILGNETLLKAGRAYLALLLENDRLPRGEQLTPEELTLPRGLLLDFFSGQSSIQSRAQEVLGLVERKFSQRSFEQATILLQLFETDQSTKLQNERKLFYEDMIQRLGIRRRHPLSRADTEQVQRRFGEHASALSGEDYVGQGTIQALARTAAPWLEPSADDSVAPIVEKKSTLEFTKVDVEPDEWGRLVKSFDWLAARHQIHLLLRTRSASEFKQWNSIAQLGSAADGDELRSFIPPTRWRAPIDFAETNFMTLLAAHSTRESMRHYVLSLTKVCYFLLLAVGDTGLEGYLDTYFDWLNTQWDIDGTDFIDRLHRESAFGESTLSLTLNTVFEEHFAVPIGHRPVVDKASALQDALIETLKGLSRINYAEIAPGHYDLGGLVLDRLMGVKYPTPEFAFKVHRIV